MLMLPPAVAVAAAAVIVLPVSVLAKEPASKPSIVVLLADDLGWNDVGFTRGVINGSAGTYNGPQAQTPNLDALAHDGVVLLHHYAYRYCSPSRAAFLTGRIPAHAHESNPWITANGCTNLNYTMIPAALKQLGYATAMVGKWHQGLQTLDCVPTGRGFDHSFGYLSGAEDHVDQTVTAGCGCVEGQGGCVDLWRDRGPAHGENGTYNGFSFPREAVRLIEATPLSTPLFLYVAWQEVHGPYEVDYAHRSLFPPDPDCRATAKDNPTCCGYTDRFHSPCSVYGTDGVCKCDGGKTAHENASLFCPPGGQCSREYMLGMLAALDTNVGNVTAVLKSTDRFDNTVIVFSSDNGGAVAGAPQHGSMNNHPLRGGKSAYFEGGVRVAAFVSSPLLPAAARGTTCDSVISIADWWQTFWLLAGGTGDPEPADRAVVGGGGGGGRRGPQPKPFGPKWFARDSVNVWPAITGATRAPPRGELLLGTEAGGALLRADGYKLVNAPQSPEGWYGPYSPNCTDGATSLPTDASCASGCLFNVRADAGEHVNLKGAQPATYAAMVARYKELAGEVVAQLADARAGDGGGSGGVAAPPSPACQAMRANGGFWSPWGV